MNSNNVLEPHLAKVKAARTAHLSSLKSAMLTIIVGIFLLLLVILSSCGGLGAPAAATPTANPTAASATPTAASATPTANPTVTPDLTSDPTAIAAATANANATAIAIATANATPTANTVGITPTAIAAQGSTLVLGSILSTLKIEVDIPPLQVNHQTLIRVSLFPTGGSKLVSNIDVIPNSTVSIAKATPVGTPRSTLKDAFGKNNDVLATATLKTNKNIFTVDPSEPQEKPLDLERVIWDWYVTPLISGKQVIGVYIEVRWLSKSGGQPSLPYIIGNSILQVDVGTIFWFDIQVILSILATIIVPVIVALIAVPGFRRWVINLFQGKKLRGKKAKPIRNHS